jgi:hypothetical protein
LFFVPVLYEKIQEGAYCRRRVALEVENCDAPDKVMIG